MPEKKQVSFTYLPTPEKIQLGAMPEPKQVSFSSVDEFLAAVETEKFEAVVGMDSKILQASIGDKLIDAHTVKEVQELAQGGISLTFHWDHFKSSTFETVKNAFNKELPCEDQTLGSVTVGDLRYNISVNSLEFMKEVAPNDRFFYLSPAIGLTQQEAASKQDVQGSQKFPYIESEGMGLPVSLFSDKSYAEFQESMQHLMIDHIVKHDLDHKAGRDTGFWEKCTQEKEANFQR